MQPLFRIFHSNKILRHCFFIGAKYDTSRGCKR
ncbi:unnamed protein product [Acanthoscelides obtectus]|uniref:Uncharacterized protein n=1 Tax=Acanthoscelides obtectus TaxID=200917 RepID=A0A9P0K8X9_ACAOB|nr:unnamed protein product [Acanthoscelides obtectus]CAK1673477.1 hypothetical protein AOBTE_LOCUS29353 [Acanthoscelides obtectus]